MQYNISPKPASVVITGSKVEGSKTRKVPDPFNTLPVSFSKVGKPSKMSTARKITSSRSPITSHCAISTSHSKSSITNALAMTSTQQRPTITTQAPAPVHPHAVSPVLNQPPTAEYCPSTMKGIWYLGGNHVVKLLTSVDGDFDHAILSKLEAVPAVVGELALSVESLVSDDFTVGGFENDLLAKIASNTLEAKRASMQPQLQAQVQAQPMTDTDVAFAVVAPVVVAVAVATPPPPSPKEEAEEEEEEEEASLAPSSIELSAVPNPLAAYKPVPNPLARITPPGSPVPKTIEYTNKKRKHSATDTRLPKAKSVKVSAPMIKAR